MSSSTRSLLVAACACASLVLAEASAHADERAGLGGIFSERRLTTPKNSLAMIAGPGQSPLFGQRFGANSVDGGFGFHRLEVLGDLGTSETQQTWLRAGVAFGLLDNLEMGALFATFRVSPDFEWTDFPVYFTYSWTFEDIDVGARFSFVAPIEGDWSVNPGVPVLLRLDNARIDGGLFVPVIFEDSTITGLHVPLRYIRNASPRVFWGVQSGFTEPSFDTANDTSLSLGGLVGYTRVRSGKVLDLTVNLTWDDLLLLDAAEGIDSFQFGAFRLLVGVTIHSLVM